MKIYNTLTKRKEEFVPIEEGKVRMYVCGPTVYNLIHIGNARPMIVFDTVRRYMEYKGYEVNYVSNFTDVDDKIIKAANAGKHIFTEKVLTSAYCDALEVKKAVEEAGIKFCISFPWRTRADFLWIKEALGKDIIGQVTYMRMRNAHDGVSRGWLPPSFLDPVPTCGGAMMDLGAHGMYLLNWFMGEPVKCTSVFTNCLCNSVEDNCVSVFSYKNGAIGVSETGFVTGRNPFELEIAGTNGTILAGGVFDKLCYNNGDGWVYPNLGKGSKSAINSFCDAINGDGEPLFGIDDAVALTKTMEMAYKNII